MWFAPSFTLIFFAALLSPIGTSEKAKPQRDARALGVEVRILCIAGPAGFLDRKEFDKCAWKGKPSYLIRADNELQEFLEAMQGNRLVDLTQLPIVRTRDCEWACANFKHCLMIRTWQSRPINGNLVFNPEFFEGYIYIGAQLSVQPIYSHDRKLMDIAIKGELFQSAGPVDLTLLKTDTCLPLFVPKSRVQKMTFESCGTIPAGRTLMIQTDELLIDLGRPPGASKIPYLDCLFSRVSGIQKRQVLILVTPRLAKPEVPITEGIGSEFLDR